MSDMMMLAVAAYVCFVAITAALVWAVSQAGEEDRWQPGRNPHARRF